MNSLESLYKGVNVQMVVSEVLLEVLKAKPAATG